MILIVTTFVLSLDQSSKFIANRYLQLHQSFPLIPGVFHLTLVHNRGAAFGILKNQVPLFIATSIACIVLVYFHLRGSDARNNRLYRAALSLLLAGALGNLIDRVLLGYVIDFLDFRFWPVFNVADSAITIGAVLLGYTILKAKKA